MNELLLLRHAEAVRTADDHTDRSRLLSTHGQNQARAVGRWLATQANRPDHVICSPARRTCLTASLVLEAWQLPPPPIDYIEGIYAATAGQLLALLENYDNVRCVLLVGHNPGLAHLFALLCQHGTRPLPAMTPAMIAHVQLTGVAQLGHGRLLGAFTP